MSLEFATQPAEQAALISTDAQQLYGQLTRGELCPLEAGLVDEPVRLRDGLRAQFYTQNRVSRMSSTGDVEEAAIVKLRTMHDLTEDGTDFVNELMRIVGEGNTDLSTKELGAWRVSRPLLRKLSGDEMPQLICNVFGIGKDWFPGTNLMKMGMFGPARPPIANEMVIKGDNSSGPYNRALEIVAYEAGFNDRFELHSWLAEIYRPALFTPATARGKRQLNEDGYISWIHGILDYHSIEQMPKSMRSHAMGSMITGTIKHIILRTDAV